MPQALNLSVTDSERGYVPSSLYIHIPFCGSRCFYCDFTTYVAPPSAIEKYVHVLCDELDMIAEEATAPLQTVFFGGGTPTLLNTAQWAYLLEHLHKRFSFAADAEMTVEANPGTVDRDKLQMLRQHGVNRVSFGAQTLDNRLLMTIGRLHDADAVFRSVELAHEVGLPHINVDLMFGLPEQSLADVRASLDGVIGMAVDHVSAYWLKVEPGTPFAKWQSQGALPLPGEDAEADMYDLVCERLQAHGYRHYEVSNFALPGAQARHNLVYWNNKSYFAAGVGAHGYVRGVRQENVKPLGTYGKLLAGGQRPFANTHPVSVWEAVEDTMMLGLRLREGVSLPAFESRHGVTVRDVFGEIVDRLTAQGLLIADDHSIRLTERAWPVANVVFEQFVGTRPETSNSD